MPSEQVNGEDMKPVLRDLILAFNARINAMYMYTLSNVKSVKLQVGFIANEMSDCPRTSHNRRDLKNDTYSQLECKKQNARKTDTWRTWMHLKKTAVKQIHWQVDVRPTEFVFNCTVDNSVFNRVICDTV